MHIEMRRGKASKKGEWTSQSGVENSSELHGCKYITSECGRFDYWGLGGREEVCMHGV